MTQLAKPTRLDQLGTLCDRRGLQLHLHARRDRLTLLSVRQPASKGQPALASVEVGRDRDGGLELAAQVLIDRLRIDGKTATA